MVSGLIVIIKLDTGETSFLPFDQKIHKYTVDIFPRGNIYIERDAIMPYKLYKYM